MRKGAGEMESGRRETLKNHQNLPLHCILGVMTEGHQRQLQIFSFSGQTDEYAKVVIILSDPFD